MPTSMTPEQQKLRDDLLAQYGAETFLRALEISGLRSCLQALATDALSDKERIQAYERAGMHLARLLESMMSNAYTARRITECAKRLDAAVEMWALDDIEARVRDLPPARGA